MKKLALAGAIAALLAPAARGGALLVAHPKTSRLQDVRASQLENVKHVRYVCRHGARANRRRNCAALVWLRRELRETERAIASRRVARTAAGGSSAVASWYGPGLYGNGMACGGVLTPATNGVAHRSLACGTRLLVCYSGRCRETSVVDRGPFVGGRDFDLTGGLAASLGFGGVGTITYRLL